MKPARHLVAPKLARQVASHEILFAGMSKLAFRPQPEARRCRSPILAQPDVAFHELLNQNTPAFDLARAGRRAIGGTVVTRLSRHGIESPGDFRRRAGNSGRSGKAPGGASCRER